MLATLLEQDQAADQVVDVTEAPGLRAVAEDGDRLLLHRLTHERRDRAPVVRAHAWAVGVEDADDRGVDALLAVVGHRQRLGVALRLVVDAARADRVHVAPVRLRLWVHLRIAVDLARGGEQEASALELGEPERVVRPVGADLERLQRQAQVVDRAGRAREVVDEVDRLVDLEMARQVVVEKEEPLATVVLDVLQRPGLEVVDADDAVLALEERVAEMRAEEPGTARDDRGRHRGRIYPSLRRAPAKIYELPTSRTSARCVCSRQLEHDAPARPFREHPPGPDASQRDGGARGGDAAAADQHRLRPRASEDDDLDLTRRTAQRELEHGALSARADRARILARRARAARPGREQPTRSSRPAQVVDPPGVGPDPRSPGVEGNGGSRTQVERQLVERRRAADRVSAGMSGTACHVDPVARREVDTVRVP